MNNTIAAEIERWFRDHPDGEFVRSPQDAPMVLDDSASNSRFVVYTTKHTISQQFVDRGFPRDKRPGLIGRYGLPSEKEISRLPVIVGDRQLCFLGDFDPPDLLVFAWLRSHMDVSHIGVNDVFLETLDFPIDERWLIQLSDSERQSSDLIDRLIPDFRDLVGANCAALVDRGYKLELEAVASLGGTKSTSLASVFPA